MNIIESTISLSSKNSINWCGDLCNWTNYMLAILKETPLFIVLSPKTIVVSKETHTNLHNYIYPSFSRSKEALWWCWVAGWPSDPHWRANPAWSLGSTDVTSHPGFQSLHPGYPDDITMGGDQMTDHGQTVTSGFLMMSRHVIAHPGYRTDVGIITPTLTAECWCTIRCRSHL